MTYFFDRCFPHRLAQVLRVLQASDQRSGSIELIHHNDRSEFNELTKDVEWNRVVSQSSPKPLVVSADVRIHTRPDEAREIQKANLTFVCLAHQWAMMPIWESAWKFLKRWPEILKETTALTHPAIFRLTCGHSLKLERLKLTRDLRPRR